MLVTCGLACWLQYRLKKMVFLFTFTIIVFRADTAVLFAPILLWMLLDARYSILRIIKWGILSTIASLALTITVDSYFWYDPWLWSCSHAL